MTPGVILAIDYGQKRLGLALSDEHGITSRPFATWNRINRRRDLARRRSWNPASVYRRPLSIAARLREWTGRYLPLRLRALRAA